MSHKLSADEARSWLADRMGKIVTATLTTGGRVETADTGRLREYDDGYRIGEIAFVGSDDPTLSVEYELRWDDPDVDPQHTGRYFHCASPILRGRPSGRPRL